MTADRETQDTGDDSIASPRNWDIVAEDLFALNVRAIRAIWASVTAPSKLFAAARDKYWHNRYTPSLRLYFSLVALISALQFFWLGEGSALNELAREMVSQSPEEWGGRDAETATQDIFAAFIIVLPFGYALAHILAGLLMRVWGKGTPAVERVRLYFCTLIPGTLLGIASTMALAQIPPEALKMTQIPTYILFFGVYAATYFFGMAREMSAGGRAWRAGVLAALISIVDFAGVFIALSLAQAYVMGTPG